MPDPDPLADRRFPTTHWSLVGQAGREPPLPDAPSFGAEGFTPRGPRAALGTLLTLYMPALRAHLTEAKGLGREAADDLLQSFVLTKFLEQNLAAQADPARGKFRTLVLTALDHFVIDQRRRALAEKRAADRAVPADPGAVADVRAATSKSAVAPPEAAFDIAWARQVLAEVVQRMEDECRSSGRADIWGVFEARILGPTLQGAEPPTYLELVQRFGFKSPLQASNALVTAKRMFERNLRDVIGEYAASPGEVDDEIRDLWVVLSRGGARSR